ncbi:MAG: radical SAM protein [Chloroflexi bacterium]|nr:radical SAM protein [Chloroflexota bacterium]
MERLTRVEELESCFRKYPDVPEEVVVKEDCLRYGISWTEVALEASQGFQLKSYYLFQFDRSSREAMRQDESIRAPEDIKIFGGDYGLKDTVVANHVSADSPYLVDAVDGRLRLFDRGDGGAPRPIAEVKLRRPPKYYGLRFEDGRPYSEIIGAPGWAHIAFVTVLRNCQYWSDKEECKFCDINANVREQKVLGRPYTVHKKVDEVVRVVEAAYADYVEGVPPIAAGEYESVWEMGPHSIQISGGTVVDRVQGKDDCDFYIQYVEAIKDKIGSRFPLMLQTAAKNKSDLKRLRAAGVDVQISNFEVWDKGLFQVICPGKESFVGRDEWIKRICESVEVFGEAGTHPGFVAGVEMAQPWGFKTVREAIKSTTEGFEFLMSHGVIPRPITWCIEPLSALAGHPMIPLDYFVQLDRNWYETWRKYGLPVPLGHGPFETGRGRYPNSAYCDMGPHTH